MTLLGIRINDLLRDKIACDGDMSLLTSALGAPVPIPDDDLAYRRVEVLLAAWEEMHREARARSAGVETHTGTDAADSAESAEIRADAEALEAALAALWEAASGWPTPNKYGNAATTARPALARLLVRLGAPEDTESADRSKERSESAGGQQL